MDRLIRHYSSMSSVTYIKLLWEHMEKFPEISVDFGHIDIQFDLVFSSRDDLSDRFHPLPQRSGCVIIADDDIYVTEKIVNAAIKLWSTHPSQIVGLFPRGHLVREQEYFYNAQPHVNFSMVLTKFMVLDASFLEAYHKLLTSDMKDFIRESRNCEDIGMNFVAANLTGMPPVYLEDGSKIDFGSESGIWKRAGHSQVRSRCMNLFRELAPSLPTSNSAHTMFGQTVFHGDSFIRANEEHARDVFKW